MSPSNEPDDLHALAGEYVLGTLPMAEREAFEARLANDPELQKVVAAWEERFFPYTAMVEPVTPSDYLWPRIERSLKASATRAPSSVPTRAPRPNGPRRRLMQSLPFWRGVAGAGLAAALAMGVLLTNVTTAPATPATLSSLMRSGSSPSPSHGSAFQPGCRKAFTATGCRGSSLLRASLRK